MHEHEIKEKIISILKTSPDLSCIPTYLIDLQEPQLRPSMNQLAPWLPIENLFNYIKVAEDFHKISNIIDKLFNAQEISKEAKESIDRLLLTI